MADCKAIIFRANRACYRLNRYYDSLYDPERSWMMVTNYHQGEACLPRCWSEPVAGSSPGPNDGNHVEHSSSIDACRAWCTQMADCKAIIFRANRACYRLNRYYDSLYDPERSWMMVTNYAPCASTFHRMLRHPWTHNVNDGGHGRSSPALRAGDGG